jgi:hypothetical protein
MKVIISIECDNAAFDTIDCGNEVARILRFVANHVEGCNVPLTRRHLDGLKLRDVSGNTVGSVTVEG